jgi:hypothetical protein
MPEIMVVKARLYKIFDGIRKEEDRRSARVKPSQVPKMIINPGV